MSEQKLSERMRQDNQWLYSDLVVELETQLAEAIRDKEKAAKLAGQLFQTEHAVAGAFVQVAPTDTYVDGPQAVQHIVRKYKEAIRERDEARIAMVVAQDKHEELLGKLSGLQSQVNLRDDILSDIRDTLGREGLLDMQIPDYLGELLERLARAEEDSARLQWYLSDKPKAFLDTYMQGVREQWDIERWRREIDSARAKEGAVE